MLSWPDGEPNIADELGQTPVHLAARCGRASCLHLLLDKGGDLNIRDKNGKTPIQLADGIDDCMNVILAYQISAMISKYRQKEVKGIKTSLMFNYIASMYSNFDKPQKYTKYMTQCIVS